MKDRSNANFDKLSFTRLGVSCPKKSSEIYLIGPFYTGPYWRYFLGTRRNKGWCKGAAFISAGLVWKISEMWRNKSRCKRADKVFSKSKPSIHVPKIEVLM